MDIIRIEELQIFAHHGVFPSENEKGQHFYINAELYVDTEQAGHTDALTDSVDYGAVCSLLSEVMTGQTCKLLEAAAQSCAMAVLRTFPLVERIVLEIRKPEAPIPMAFRSVSVQIDRGWHKAVIALGSNMGDSRAYMTNAVTALRNSEEFRHITVSDFIRTKPYGYTEQADFLNGVLLCETVHSPHGLLRYLRSLEQEADRKRDIHWGPRTLDLDVIFYDDVVMSDEELTVPHPDMQNRRFVLAPLVQIAPYYRHPVSGLTAAQMLERLHD